MIFDHINISAPRVVLEELKQFYCQLFELTPGFRPQFRRAGYWLYAGQQAVIHLTESEEHQAPGAKPSFDHIAFRTRDIVHIKNKLRTMGLEFEEEYLEELCMTQLFLRDPMGHGLEINGLQAPGNA